MIAFLRNIFTLNQEIIYFIYGLTFFVMGLAIALQSRHSSHLELARSLGWLAAFGFLHGLHEWGELFIPIQAGYLSPQIITLLLYINLALLVVSFICLYAFGLALLEPLEHRRVFHVGFAVLLVCWFMISFIAFRDQYPGFTVWYDSVNAITRYLIGLPSGLMAAYGLREHTLKRIAPYNVPRIFRAMQLSGISMALYALAAGLIVPPAPFFPANWLNTETFAQYAILPPQLFRATLGLAMALTTIRFLEIFDVETSRQIEAMEHARVQAEEREHLARELHDGTIQKVYTAGLLVRSAAKLSTPDSPLAGRLETAVGVLDDAISDLRENLGQLKAPMTTAEPIKSAIHDLATDPRFSSLVTVDLNLDLPDTYYLSPERTFNVLSIVQEALANIVRHARARHVTVAAGCPDNRLRIQITDDGIGIKEDVTGGQGIHNMRDRASLLHGSLTVEKLTRGTSVILELPKEES
jgi:signal transduction histidine kinase